MKHLIWSFLFICLAACGSKGGSGGAPSVTPVSSSSSSPSDRPYPVISMLESYQVAENVLLNLATQVTGSGPFKYQLIASSDAVFFSINESTGELTIKKGIDFEKPESEKGTNQYALSFVVTEVDKRSATQNIIVDVQNVDEHELVVDYRVFGDRLGIRNIAFNAASDELLLQIYSNSTTQYPCSLNLNSMIINSLVVSPICNTLTEIYMSRINSSLDTVGVAHWGNPANTNGGRIVCFNFKSQNGGDLTEVDKAQAPYYLTNEAVFNAERTQYFGVGFKLDPLNPTVYQSHGELVAIDMAN